MMCDVLAMERNELLRHRRSLAIDALDYAEKLIQEERPDMAQNMIAIAKRQIAYWAIE